MTEAGIDVTPAPKAKRSLARRVGIAAGSLVAIVAIVVGGAFFVAEQMDVEVFMQTGHAMVPSLPARTRFLRIPYRGAQPVAGDMVLVRDAFGSEQIARRVIAVPGDRIAMNGFAPIRNGRAIGARVACPARLREMICMRESIGARQWMVTWSKRSRPRASQSFPSVPRGFVYVLADHRDAARDSRDPLFGALPFHAVLGRIEPLRR
jgi:signal peptidase I